MAETEPPDHDQRLKVLLKESVLLQLERKFGLLAPAVKERVAALPPEKLRQLQLDFVNAQSLKELHLED